MSAIDEPAQEVGAFKEAGAEYFDADHIPVAGLLAFYLVLHFCQLRNRKRLCLDEKKKER